MASHCHMQKQVSTSAHVPVHLCYMAVRLHHMAVHLSYMAAHLPHMWQCTFPIWQRTFPTWQHTFPSAPLLYGSALSLHGSTPSLHGSTPSVYPPSGDTLTRVTLCIVLTVCPFPRNPGLVMIALKIPCSASVMTSQQAYICQSAF